MQEPENDCSYYPEDELSSALSRPGEFISAEGIQILPHLPKYSICITKGPSEFLGTYNFFKISYDFYAIVYRGGHMFWTAQKLIYS